MISETKYNVFIWRKIAFFRKKTAFFNHNKAQNARNSLNINDLEHTWPITLQIGITSQIAEKPRTAVFTKNLHKTGTKSSDFLSSETIRQ